MSVESHASESAIPRVSVVIATLKEARNLPHVFAGLPGDLHQVIVMLDADGSTDAAEMVRFVDALLDGADFVKGSRFLPGGGSDDLTWLRRLGNGLLSGLVNRLFGTGYTDLCYGYNAFRSRCLEALAVDCDGFEVEGLRGVREGGPARVLRVREAMAYHRGMDTFRRQGARRAELRCRCGHPRAAHEHYRNGTECALCGPAVCPRYRRRWPWSRVTPKG
jgi:hypothetical protein